MKEIHRGLDNNLLRTIAKNTLSTILVSAAGTSLIGKPVNGDFDVAYTSRNTITASGLPAAITTLASEDIIAVVQYDTYGNFVQIFTKDMSSITVAANVITVPGANFEATDTFLVITNYAAASSSGGGIFSEGEGGTDAVVAGAAKAIVFATAISAADYALNINIYSTGGLSIGFTLDTKLTTGFTVTPSATGIMNWTAVKI